MKNNPAYREFHPKWHRTPVSTYWWLSQWSYTKFILRELSSVFVAYFILITLMQVRALGQGPAEYAAFQEFMTHPFVVLLNVVAFLFLLLHTITWFNLTPRAIVLRLRGKRGSRLADHRAQLRGVDRDIGCRRLVRPRRLEWRRNPTLRFSGALFSAGGVTAAFLLPVHVFPLRTGLPPGLDRTSQL